MRVFETRSRDCRTLAFSPDGHVLAAGGHIIDLWRLAGGGKEYLRFPGSSVKCLAFHPHRPLVFALVGNEFRVDEIVDDDFRPRYYHTLLADRLAVSPDGTGAVLSGRIDMSQNGSRLRRYDTDANALVAGWPSDPAGGGNLHWALTWLPGTDRFAVAEWEGDYPNYAAVITVRDAATGGVVARAACGSSRFDALAAGPDGALAAIQRTALSVWPGGDLTRPPGVIKNDTRKHFTAVAFHPSGKYLAATSNDATVKLYDATTWAVARAFTWEVGKMQSVAFSPDGTLAAAGSDSRKVVVWDVDL